jgi:hypothetical protein
MGSHMQASFGWWCKHQLVSRGRHGNLMGFPRCGQKDRMMGFENIEMGSKSSLHQSESCETFSTSNSKT